MQHLTRLAALLCIATLLAACASTPTDENRVTEATDSGPNTISDPGGSVPEVLDPTDYDNPANIDNPDSLLSKRLVYFDYDSSRVRPEFMEIVRAHAQFLSSNPGAQVRLEGHADERGTREYNLGLGERRARSVMDMMVARGASRGQSNTISYGEERPVQTCSSESCWSQNRRVEIVYSNR